MHERVLDWTGRETRPKPGGRIRGAPPKVLTALRIDEDGIQADDALVLFGRLE